MERGPGLNEEEPVIDRTLERYNSAVLSAWLQGRTTADSYLQEEKSEQAGTTCSRPQHAESHTLQTSSPA